MSRQIWPSRFEPSFVLRFVSNGLKEIHKSIYVGGLQFREFAGGEFHPVTSSIPRFTCEPCGSHGVNPGEQRQFFGGNSSPTGFNLGNRGSMNLKNLCHLPLTQTRSFPGQPHSRRQGFPLAVVTTPSLLR